jgi:putative nucleotidyltransferase with HDIG domain
MANQELGANGAELTVETIPVAEQRRAELIERERERNEKLIRQQLNRLASLRTIDVAIAGSLNLSLTLNIIIEQVITQLNVDAADVLLLNKHSQLLEYVAGRGFYTNLINDSHVRLGEGYAGRVALERNGVNILDLPSTGDHFTRQPLIQAEVFHTYHATPLIAKGHVLGVLELFCRAPFIPDQEWIDYFEIMAGQTAIAVDSITLFNDLQRSNTELILAYDATIEGWSRALDLRDKETEGHTQRVTNMTVQLAQSIGLNEADIVHIRRGALLHDIGKMGIPDNILLKSEPLTEEEWAIMRRHPTYALELLSPIAFLAPALHIPYCHHEEWDGSGYPRGLKGEQIPLAARLFAIVDVWDALRSDRPYRPAWSEEKVKWHILNQVGKHFDPQVADAFLDLTNKPSRNSFAFNGNVSASSPRPGCT